MNGLAMRLDVRAEANAAHVRLFGLNAFESSLFNAEAISDHVASRGLTGLIMDWRECVMTHNLTQFHRVVEIFAARLPPETRFAVLHRPDQLSYAMFMTRQLAGNGLHASAFSDEVSALAWLAAPSGDGQRASELATRDTP